jgi:thioredoxin 2
MSLLVPERQAICGRCKAELDIFPKPAQVDASALERAIASSPAPVLVDFWAPWCAPCRAFAPILEAYAREAAGRIVVLKVDTQAQPEAAARHQISAIPTLALFRGGREIERVSGALPAEELRRWVELASTKIGP